MCFVLTLSLRYDEARQEDEETLLSFTELLKQARLVEVHDIEDPAAVGVDVHTQLTELFEDKYGDGIDIDAKDGEGNDQ